MNPLYRSFLKFIRIFLIVFILNVSFVLGQVPRTISVQGVLSGLSFKSEQLHVITTTLYAVGAENASLYSQTDTLNIDRDGLFTIQLGKERGLPATLAFDKQYVVEFIVNGILMPMRIPLQSVPYAITSEKVTDNSVELRHLSEGLKQTLQFHEEPKSGKGENTLGNYVNGFRAVIAGGDENRTSSNFASITGGFSNSVSAPYGAIGGGQANMVQGNYGFVGGGSENRAQGSWSTVTAGNANIVTSSSMYGTVSGGQTNQVGGYHGTIGGGRSNFVTSQAGTVSGGQENRAMQTFATVSGGQNNISSGMHSTIGGGSGNTSSGQVAAIAGGMNNKANGQYSVVSGGANNEANGNHAVVSGGLNNDAYGEFTNVSGGQDNVVSSNARHSFIAGGTTNKINSGNTSGIMGSNNSLTTSNNGYIIGTNNTVSSSSNGMAIGFNNQVSGQNATAIGTGHIASGNHEFVVGSFASNSTNPANTSNTAFTGNRRFSVGIGSSSSQRKNAITVFENGNTLFQGGVLTTDASYLHSVEIANNTQIGGTLGVNGNSSFSGNVGVTGNTTIGGNLSVSGSLSATNLSGTNTGNVSIGTANGLSLSGQTLSLATATTTTAGAMSASDKVKLDGISTGATGSGFTHWIGENYGGGVIFHLYKDNQGVEHGLILALTDQSSSQSWSNIIQEIGASSQSSWNGSSNSNAIVNQSGHTNSAAKLCLDLVSGGQNDWYMPSIQELSLLWNNYFTVANTLTQIQSAQLLGNYYWSSTEYCADYGWYISFTNGSTDYNYKTNSTNVRAIRAF